MLRVSLLCIMLPILTGCACKPDGDDPIWGRPYWDGCWAEAKGET